MNLKSTPANGIMRSPAQDTVGSPITAGLMITTGRLFLCKQLYQKK